MLFHVFIHFFFCNWFVAHRLLWIMALGGNHFNASAYWQVHSRLGFIVQNVLEQFQRLERRRIVVNVFLEALQDTFPALGI